MNVQIRRTLDILEESVCHYQKDSEVQKRQSDNKIIGCINRLIVLDDQLQECWNMNDYIDLFDDHQIDWNIRNARMLDLNHTLATIQCIIKQKYFQGKEDAIVRRINNYGLLILIKRLKEVA